MKFQTWRRKSQLYGNQKICSACLSILELDEFYIDNSKPHRRSSQCKDCTKDRRRKYRSESSGKWEAVKERCRRAYHAMHEKYPNYWHDYNLRYKAKYGYFPHQRPKPENKE